MPQIYKYFIINYATKPQLPKTGPQKKSCSCKMSLELLSNLHNKVRVCVCVSRIMRLLFLDRFLKFNYNEIYYDFVCLPLLSTLMSA